MFRVIYCWRVSPHNFQRFKAKWSEATQFIHETVPGALGSFMLQDTSDSSKVLTIAKWESRASWQAFWQDNNPKQMHEMRNFAERISVETFEEVDDFTV